MTDAPLHAAEQARQAALRSLQILDTPEEERFDRLTRLVSAHFDVPICLISFVDETRQWFKSRCGLGVRATSRDVSFCAHAILQDEVMVVEDTLSDPRFATNSLVIGEPKIRFYAGAQLRSPEGLSYGTLCVIDRRPRSFSAENRRHLDLFAKMVLRELGVTALHRRYEGLVADRIPPSLDLVPVGIFKLDAAGRCTLTNRRWRLLTGLSEEEALDSRWTDAVHPADRERVLRAWNEAALDDRDQLLESRFLSTSGEVCWAQTRIVPLRRQDGRTTEWLGTCEDVTERRFMEQTLRESEERFRQLADAIDDVFWITELEEERVVYVSPAYREIWGRDPEDLYRMPRQWTESIHEEDRAEAVANFEQATRSGEPYEETFRIRRPDGEIRWIRDRGFPLCDESGRPYRIVGLAQDITRQREAESELEHLASIDRLTGLLNVVTFRARVSEELMRARRSQTPTSLVMVDVDHLKHINDTHGHAAGDRAILRVAEILRGHLRISDVIGR